jgi:hypothetical protein
MTFACQNPVYYGIYPSLSATELIHQPQSTRNIACECNRTLAGLSPMLGLTGAMDTLCGQALEAENLP